MADENRSINICLINTLKPTAGLPDNNRIGIDHVNSFIWFDDKDQRDNYMALKTVHSQTQNSKIHDFNNPDNFRIAMSMKDYYALDVDLIKVNHTMPGLEGEYFYNITDVNYVNNGVTEIEVVMNPVYTYFMDEAKEKNQIQGVVKKSNFKNQNYDIAYVNKIAQGLIGDNYGAVNFDANTRHLIEPTNPSSDLKHQISWIVVSLRKKPNLIDDSTNGDILNRKVILNSFSDEIILFMPIDNKTGVLQPIRDSAGKIYESSEAGGGHVLASEAGYLLLNGAIVLPGQLKGFLKELADAYSYVTSMPFTFSSFFDVQEIGILPEPPLNYTVTQEGTGYIPKINSPMSETQVHELKLKNNITEKVSTIYAVGISAVDVNTNNPNAIQLSKYPIISNAEKLKLFNNGFENIENNIIYNSYFIKFYNTMSSLNPFNLLGSPQALYVSTIYLGANYKKLFVSTDTNLESVSLKDQFNGVGNSDFVIKFNGLSYQFVDESTLVSQGLLGALDVIGPLAGGAIGAMVGGGLGLVGGPVGAGAGASVGASIGNSIGSSIGGGVAGATHKVSDVISTNLQQSGGSSGYANSNGFSASNFFSSVEEYVPKLIYHQSEQKTSIDNITNFYGTSCSIFTNNLKDYVKDIINNRSNHKCYIKGDFRVNYLYPQVNDELYGLLSKGIMFMKKLS